MGKYPDYLLFQDAVSGKVEHALEFTDECDDSDGSEAPAPSNDWFRERIVGGSKTIACDREDRIDMLCYYWNLLRGATASPIERRLADALMWRCTMDAQRYPLVIPKGDRWRTKSGFTIAPQLSIPPYRADFVIALCESEDHPGGMYFGHELPHAFEACLVVECDGHDFHERTKEQAARDKRRDRFLLEQGYPVVRFTGSEIHADALGCADQVITALKAIIARQEADTRDMRLTLHKSWGETASSPWHAWKGRPQ